MKKVIISGGGTGGHIFPALSIADEIKARYPAVSILFVGAEDRMEMEKVPAAGYQIVGLPVAGFDRKHWLKNIQVLIKLNKSLRIARKTIRQFKPEIAIGVGGYASGPILKAAGKAGIPTVIQEQNSYAGITNKLLAQKADRIFVAYEGMERFFPKDKIIVTGNPIRQNLKNTGEDKDEAYKYFRLDPTKKTILLIGGSLGARTLNNSLIASLEKIRKNEVQFIWQCGKIYYQAIESNLSQYSDLPIKLFDFISRMDYAYAASDLVISRAGASSISELCVLGKPALLVPSPNVAEDHQTKNAMALVKQDAAILVRDADAEKELVQVAMDTVNDKKLLTRLAANISEFAHPDAVKKIVDEIEKVLSKKK